MIYLFPLLSLYALWVFYLAVMNLKRARDTGRLTKTAERLGFPVLLLGYLLDFIGNMIPATLVFMELPREGLVTSRVQRHYDGPPTWRRSVAVWFAENLLDPFDPKGYHIKK